MIVSAAEEMNPTKRSTMEDCHVYHGPGFLNCGDPEMSLLGVYDGHGGRDIVEFLESRLAKNIAEEIRQPDDASVPQRLERAFLITDVQSRMEGLNASGATVVVCLVKKNTSRSRPRRRDARGDTTTSTTTTIYAANCGDARAVLSSRRGGRGSTPSTRLTRDHRASDPDEAKRINAAGGFVLKNRVVGVLAVTRSLGDHGLKEFVIGRPDVNEVEVCRGDEEEGEEEFVILACDGLWDVIDDDDAVNLVKKSVGGGGRGMDDKVRDEKKKEAAQMLIDEAMRRGTTDNVTVIVAWL